MAVELTPQRSTYNLPPELDSVRFALSWCRGANHDHSIAGRVKKRMGMDLDLVVTPHSASGRVTGLFLPSSTAAAYWLWHSHDDKRGGRVAWDESVIVDLHQAPPEVGMLTFAAMALKPRTSFNAIPKVTLDVYDIESNRLASTTTLLPYSLSEDPDENVNGAAVLKLVRAGGGWSAIQSRTLFTADTKDLVKVAFAMEETV